MRFYNNFELLLCVAAEECCQKDTKAFLACEDSDFELTSNVRKRFNQIAKRRKHNYWQALKIFAIACLICLSLLFTACMCHPKIRDAIFDVVIEWYESYMSIGFEPSVEEESHMPPTEIMDKAYASFVPFRYTSEVDIDNRNYYSISYYSEDIWMFSLTQNVIGEEMNWNNSEGQLVSEIQINGYKAVLIEDQSMSSMYALIWRDQNYEYNIVGLFTCKDELIKVAEGINTQ